MPAQPWPCYFRVLSQKQHMQQPILEQLLQLLSQHFSTAPVVITPTRPKISVATQNECKTVVSASTYLKLKEKKLPSLLSGTDTCVLMVLLKTCADERGLQEGRAPIQTALSHPPALAGKGKAEGFSVTWLLLLKGSGFCSIAIEYIPQILFFCAL